MREFILKKPSHSTKLRMIEVHFWYIIRVLYFKQHKRVTLPHQYELYIDNIIEAVCLLKDVKPTPIKYAISKINSPFHRPTLTEIALATKYLDFSIRNTMYLAKKGSRSIYNALEHYIKDGSPDLEPRFDQDIYLELEKFNKAIIHMFSDLNYISKTSNLVYNIDNDSLSD